MAQEALRSLGEGAGLCAVPRPGGQGKITEEGFPPWLLSPVLSGSLQEAAKAAPPSPASAPPAPPQPVTPRKNKAAMCKPLMQNRGVSCKTEMKSKGCQTGEGMVGGELPVGFPLPGTTLIPDWGGGLRGRKEGGIASSRDGRWVKSC